VLVDRARLARVFKVVFLATDAVAASVADLIASTVDTDKFQHGNHPAFSFNAFALPGGLDIPGVGILPPEVVMGDGVMEGFQVVGLGDVAPQAIFAHEYGHQVQFKRALNVSNLPAPEASRRLELMSATAGSRTRSTTAPPTSGCTPASGATASRTMPRSRVMSWVRSSSRGCST
jgi:hypothetical protein